MYWDSEDWDDYNNWNYWMNLYEDEDDKNEYVCEVTIIQIRLLMEKLMGQKLIHFIL